MLSAHVWIRKVNSTEPNSDHLQVGREGERGAAVAAAVAALVGAAGCGNCLVWSKSDAFVSAYHRAAPGSALGYIVAADAADEALARPLRLAAPEVRHGRFSYGVG